mgnify:CR=1 FL=1
MRNIRCSHGATATAFEPCMCVVFAFAALLATLELFVWPLIRLQRCVRILLLVFELLSAILV